MTVAGTRETVGGQVVQQSGIQCFNSSGSTSAGTNSDWLADTDEEIDKQELEAHYSYMAKIQEVPNADLGTDSEPLEQVQYDIGYNVFANEIQHSEQYESISNTCIVETGDSNVIPDSPDRCDNDIQNDQNAVECDDERVALANLIANLKLNVDENKKIQKQLKKANASLTQELTECKSILAETSRTLGESDTQKDIDIKEGLKLKAYEISVVKEKHDELVKQSLLTKSHYEGLVKDKTKVITDLKLKEEKDIDKIISMEKQLKFLTEIVYKQSQSIQTIHMLAPKCPTFNGRPTFANPMCLKKAQSEIPCLYEIPHDQSNPANRLIPDRDEILTLEKRVDQQNDSFTFVHELKEEMHADLKYVESLKNEIDELKSDKAEFSNMYDILLQEFASESTVQNSKSYYRMIYEKTSKAWKWWIEKQCPSGYKWVPKTKMNWVPKVRNETVKKRVSFAIDNASRITNIVQLILFIVDSGCTKHMTGNISILCNFVEKYLGTVHFGNDQFALILGYGDLVQGNITINKVYYVEGLNHNLFSVGQFCDADLEVAFRKSTCFVRDLQGNDLLTGNRGSDLYTISLQETTSSTPICLMAKASPTQAWLWHRRLSHLNFDYINLLSKKDVVIGLPKLKYVKDQLCSSCEVSKAKRSSFKTKTIPSSKGRLNLLHMDLCGPMRVASINGKKYILVIIDDYSRYTWTLFLRSKDETPEVLKDFFTMIQRNLQALVIFVRIDRGTEFLNKTLNAISLKKKEFEHQTSTPQTPE
ncbi:retrovirus-related pol polyprotein from transposon TNT 1-94 [Tanacetum coccineum]